MFIVLRFLQLIILIFYFVLVVIAGQYGFVLLSYLYFFAVYYAISIHQLVPLALLLCFILHIYFTMHPLLFFIAQTRRLNSFLSELKVQHIIVVILSYDLAIYFILFYHLHLLLAYFLCNLLIFCIKILICLILLCFIFNFILTCMVFFIDIVVFILWLVLLVGERQGIAGLMIFAKGGCIEIHIFHLVEFVLLTVDIVLFIFFMAALRHTVVHIVKTILVYNEL